MGNLGWVALFSQTGEELLEVSKALGRVPDLVLCNNPEARESPYVKRLQQSTSVAFLTHADIEKYLQSEIWEGDVVTLHGYLRLLSSATIETGATIYNGHPGAIDLYPELRGKDPQEKVIANMDKYPIIGCVIHKVTAGVDEGEIVAKTSMPFYDHLKDRDRVYKALHCLSTAMWVDFLREKVFKCKA